jgi:hypothetical protein
MYHLIYDPTDAHHMFLLLEEAEGYIVAHRWFSCLTLYKAFTEPSSMTTSVDEFLSTTPWEILTTFPTQPTPAELTTFIYSKPELLI